MRDGRGRHYGCVLVGITQLCQLRIHLIDVDPWALWVLLGANKGHIRGVTGHANGCCQLLEACSIVADIWAVVGVIFAGVPAYSRRDNGIATLCQVIYGSGNKGEQLLMDIPLSLGATR